MYLAMSGPYLLKKETHCTTVLDQLMKDEIFTDVTLTAEGQNIKAHKVSLFCMKGVIGIFILPCVCV